VPSSLTFFSVDATLSGAGGGLTSKILESVDELAGASGTVVDELAGASGIDVEELAGASGIDVEELAGASGIVVDELAGASGTDSDVPCAAGGVFGLYCVDVVFSCSALGPTLVVRFGDPGAVFGL
jgi:hypothetical protein